MKTKYFLSLLFYIVVIPSTFAQWSVNLSAVTGYYQIKAVHFIDDNTGFVGGSTGLFSGDGKISKTTDGGSSWTLVKTITGDVIYDIHFVNSNLGFAVGSGGLIAKTTDGGNTWSTQNLTEGSSGFQEPINSVYFIDQNTGYTAGGFSSQWILKTVDGGINWTELTTLPSTLFQRLYGVFFTTANIGYAVGGDEFSGGLGKIYHTTDGGGSWDTLSPGVASYFNDIYFTDANTGFIGCSAGIILKTTDAGQTWNQQNNQDPDPDDISQFSFVNSTIGYACTLGGKILKTTDAGNNWSVNGDVSSFIFSLYSISVPSVNFGASVGLSGFYAEMGSGTDVNTLVSNRNFSIYPNPSQGNLIIQNTSQNVKEGIIKIVDIQGKEVFSTSLKDKITSTYELTNLNNGMYIVFIETKENVFTEKLIIDRK